MAGTQVAKRTPMQTVLSEVASDTFIAKVKNALPEKVSPQRFVSVTVTAIKQNPDLITGSHDSLFNAVVRCAQDGLMPDGREAALVMYDGKRGKQVQYMPMITGLRKRLAEFGFDLTAYVVHEHDTFDYELGATPWVKHKPPKLGEERGSPIGAYAVAKDLRTKQLYLEVMSTAEIEHVRSSSKAKGRGPWVDWWDEMARKTVGRRLTKQLPLADRDGALSGVLDAIDGEFDFDQDGNRQPMSEGQANAASAASTSDVPVGDRHKLRDEPDATGPTDAQLNRIAQLQGQVEERMWRATLRGVFGVDDPARLSPEEADRYEQTLRAYIDGEADQAAEVIGEAEEMLDEDGNPIPF